jgi:hypothetical protein
MVFSSEPLTSIVDGFPLVAPLFGYCGGALLACK